MAQLARLIIRLNLLKAGDHARLACRGSVAVRFVLDKKDPRIFVLANMGNTVIYTNSLLGGRWLAEHAPLSASFPVWRSYNRIFGSIRICISVEVQTLFVTSEKKSTGCIIRFFSRDRFFRWPQQQHHGIPSQVRDSQPGQCCCFACLRKKATKQKYDDRVSEELRRDGQSRHCSPAPNSTGRPFLHVFFRTYVMTTCEESNFLITRQKKSRISFCVIWISWVLVMIYLGPHIILFLCQH